MSKADVITLVFIVAIVAAIILGRRKGQRLQAAAIAAARAEGYAASESASAAHSTSGVYIASPGAGNTGDIESIARCVAGILRNGELGDGSTSPAGRVLNGGAVLALDSGEPGIGLGVVQDAARHQSSEARGNRAFVAARRGSGRVRDLPAIEAREVMSSVDRD